MCEHGNGFAYIHIPKTGGNWVRETLRPLDTVVRQPYHGRPHAEDIQGKLVFTFVRHPVTWLRSFWGVRTRSQWRIEGRDLWREICITLQPFRSDDFTRFAFSIAAYSAGIIGEFYQSFMVPNIRVGRTEFLAQDLKLFLPEVNITRQPINVGHDLPPISQEIWQVITRSEARTIDRYYSDEQITFNNHRSYIMAEQKVDEKKVQKAIQDLEIDVPVMATRMVGDRLELHLYGGRVVTWAEPKPKPKPKPRAKAKPRATPKPKA